MPYVMSGSVYDRDVPHMIDRCKISAESASSRRSASRRRPTRRCCVPTRWLHLFAGTGSNLRGARPGRRDLAVRLLQAK